MLMDPTARTHMLTGARDRDESSQGRLQLHGLKANPCVWAWVKRLRISCFVFLVVLCGATLRGLGACCVAWSLFSALCSIIVVLLMHGGAADTE